MKLKKVLSLMFLVMTSLLLASCQESKIKIGILLYDEHDTFIKELQYEMIRNLPSTIDYEIAYASNSQLKQNEQLLEFLESEIDLLIINAVDRLASSTIVEKGKKHGIPIIFINREPLEEDLKNGHHVYYVGADADYMGIQQAQIASTIFGSMDNSPFDKNKDGAIQTVIIKGQQGHQDAEKRTTHSIEHLIELGYSVDLLATQVANWNREEGHLVMKRLFENYGDCIELVLANNDDMAMGAIDYLLEIDYFSNQDDFQQPIIIIGVDGTEVGVRAVEQGLLAGTVINDKEKQGKTIAELVDLIINNESIEDSSIDLVNQYYVYVRGETIIHPDLK